MKSHRPTPPLATCPHSPAPRPAPHRIQRASLALAILLQGLACAESAPPAAPPPPPSTAPTLLLIVGAPGEPEYATNFLHQVEGWSRTAALAHTPPLLLGLPPSLPDLSDPSDPSSPSSPPDRETLAAILAAQPRTGPHPLWLVLIGHGTYDGRDARFNLRGPDVTATELAAWLQPFARPLVVINTASASAPFLPALSGPDRIVITATRSGHEQNFTRFGEYLAHAFTDPASDFDHDGQVSLLEAFLNAAARVAEFYQTHGRLATEHPLLDDNGDGLGTPADWFRGVRALRQPRPGASADGARAHQLHLLPSPEEAALPLEVRARRDALELEIFQLREARPSLPEADYFARLEALLLEMARLLVPLAADGV